jgi:uncharacterized protein
VPLLPSAPDPVATVQERGGVAESDDGGDAELAGHDRGVGPAPAPLIVFDLRKLAGHRLPARHGTGYCGRVLGAGWTEAVALTAAFAVSAVATPAGISGAVLLLPFQVSVLGTPSPSVTPTNLLYNVVSTPAALYRYRRQHQTGGRLALLLITGTLPGVIAGSVIRVELVPGPEVFDLMVAGLLLPLGIWLAARPAHGRDPAKPPRRIPAPVLILLASLTGCAGGIYGIGGGAILSPVLIGFGRPASEVAPAALASTFVTSLAGVITFTILSIDEGPVAPNWPTGIAMGIGGILGGYLGARMQSRLPDALIRRIVGILAIATGALFLWSGLD